MCGTLDFALGKHTWFYGFRVSEVIYIKVQLFQFWKYNWAYYETNILILLL